VKLINASAVEAIFSKLKHPEMLTIDEKMFLVNFLISKKFWQIELLRFFLETINIIDAFYHRCDLILVFICTDFYLLNESLSA